MDGGAIPTRWLRAETLSSRVHIGADNEKLEEQCVAIIGVGGTGSYVLDFVAKTRAKEIRVFDGDRFDTHNAFRSPGAWSLVELEAKKSKVANFVDIYGKLRRKGLTGSDKPLTAENLHLLEGIPCRSHYWIRRSRVDWYPPMTEAQTARAQRADRYASQIYTGERLPPAREVRRTRSAKKGWWARFLAWLKA